MFQNPERKVAMVLVAAISLSSATYAWFVNNNSVEATGVSIYATTDDSLLIAGANDSNYGTFSSIGTSSFTSALKPATSADGINFAKLTSDARVEAAGSADVTSMTATKLMSVMSNELDNYRVDATYQLKSVGNSLDVYVTGITASTDHNLNKAIRVAITCGAITFVYNPNNGILLDTGVGSYADSTWSLTNKTYNTYSAISSGSVQTDGGKLVTISAGSTAEVHVKVWYEGQDKSCYTNNNNTSDTALDSIVVTFGSVVTPAGP